MEQKCEELHHCDLFDKGVTLTDGICRETKPMCFSFMCPKADTKSEATESDTQSESLIQCDAEPLVTSCAVSGVCISAGHCGSSSECSHGTTSR